MLHCIGNLCIHQMMKFVFLYILEHKLVHAHRGNSMTTSYNSKTQGQLYLFVSFCHYKKFKEPQGTTCLLTSELLLWNSMSIFTLRANMAFYFSKLHFICIDNINLILKFHLIHSHLYLKSLLVIGTFISGYKYVHHINKNSNIVSMSHNRVLNMDI